MRLTFDEMTDSQRINLMNRLAGINSSMNNITPQFTDEITDAMSALYSTIVNHKDPLEKFDFISSGSYKACFDLCSGWVVKFTRWEDDLEDERATYEAALNTGLGNLFAPTFYIYMPGIGMPANVMVEQGNWCDECWDTEKGDFVKDDDTYFDAVIIQRKVDYLLCDIVARFNARYTCDKEKVYNKELSWSPTSSNMKHEKYFVVDAGLPISDEEIIKEGYDCPGFVDMDYIIEDQHGPEFFKKYADFYEYWSMADLHTQNVGFMQIDNNPYHDRVVIIDWLSYSPETACTQTES